MDKWTRRLYFYSRLTTSSASKTAYIVVLNGFLRFYPFIYPFHFRKILVLLNMSPAPPIESDRDYNSTMTVSDTSRPTSGLVRSHHPEAGLYSGGDQPLLSDEPQVISPSNNSLISFSPSPASISHSAAFNRIALAITVPIASSGSNNW